MHDSRNARAPRPRPPFDLFGEIPVTWPEVAAWTIAVAGIAPDSWRFPHYVRGWNVPEKVRAAKLAGTFDQVTEADSSALRWACGAAPRWAPRPPR